MVRTSKTVSIRVSDLFLAEVVLTYLTNKASLNMSSQKTDWRETFSFMT